ncbi:ABC transporter permease [Scytonema hofmannii FACHB-248]|jgi:uncharacterized membrane protein required for colicin V production|uniref:ABC transporter permease n=1 Tax=Scytonema hofmannii FACHB-248 TaxID=1842502 RepID=A0ABR8H1B2_9CYAN|nr:MULTISPECIES: hypothetical protein [Nostocales]MBD2609050.1 ABC transporter permease [Scytonema hofmannii FACHB-248]
MGNQVVVFVGTFILFVTGLLLGYVLSQLVLGFLPFNFLTFLGTLSLILIFGTLYYVLFWQFRRQDSESFVQEIPNWVEDSTGGSQNRMKSRLVSLLSGDTAAADRLIEQAKLNYPGMPEDWYWERTIADLERDRR